MFKSNVRSSLSIIKQMYYAAMVIKSGHLNSDLKSIRNYLYFQLKIVFQFFNLSIIDLFNNFYTAT